MAWFDSAGGRKEKRWLEEEDGREPGRKKRAGGRIRWKRSGDERRQGGEEGVRTEGTQRNKMREKARRGEELRRKAAEGGDSQAWAVTFLPFFTNCSSRYRTSQSRTVIAPSSGIRSERSPSVSPIQYPVNTHRPCVSEKASGSDLWWFHESGAEHPQANSYNSLCQNSLSTELGNIYFMDSVFTTYSRIRLGHMYNQRTWQSVSCSLYGPNKSGQHGNWEHSNDPDGLLARTLYFIFSDCTVAAWCTVYPVIETPFRRTLIT